MLTPAAEAPRPAVLPKAPAMVAATAAATPQAEPTTSFAESTSRWGWIPGFRFVQTRIQRADATLNDAKIAAAQGKAAAMKANAAASRADGLAVEAGAMLTCLKIGLPIFGVAVVGILLFIAYQQYKKKS